MKHGYNPMPFNPSVRIDRSISTKLLLVVFSVYLVVMLMVTGLQLVFAYQNVQRQVHDSLLRVEQMMKPVLNHVFLEHEEKEIPLILETFLNSRVLMGIQFEQTEPQQHAWSSGIVYDVENNTIGEHIRHYTPFSRVTSWFYSLFYKPSIYHFPYIIDRPPTSELIASGSVTLYSDTNLILQEINQTFISIIVSAVIVSMTLWVFLLLAGYFYFTKPLRVLTRSLMRVAQGQFDDVKVKRFAHGETEIDLLVTAFNTMVDKVTYAQEMQARVAQAEKMSSVGRLAAGMAHEINNPLGVIVQNVQNITRRLDSTLAKNQEVAERCDLDLAKVSAYFQQRDIWDFLNGIRDSGERAAKIVTNLLGFSRKSNNAFTFEQITDSIEKALELALTDAEFKQAIDQGNLVLQRVYDSNLPPVLCEPSQIQQVVFNLLKNAVQAMQEQHTTTETIILRTYFDKDYAYIDVEDNGRGISESIRQQLFEPFFTTKEVGKGTGLGLSICYDIITQAHKGQIRVESTLGLGTKFIIQLPLSR